MVSLLILWQVVALVLFFLWAVKFAINIPGIFISAGVFARYGQSTRATYVAKIFLITAVAVVYDMRRSLLKEGWRFFKPYSKFNVIRNTLTGIRSFR